MNNKVATIVLNWNDFKHTYDCIRSIEKLSYKNNKVFLVDNNSTDDSLARLKNIFKEHNIVFVELKKNGGFACGMNDGIKTALSLGFKTILLLNNDTILEKNCLRELNNRLYSNNKIGAVVPLVYQGLEGKMISSIGGSINWKLGESRHTAHLKKDDGKFRAEETEYMPCSAALFKSEILEKSGLIPEDYFMYGEDVDWSMHIKAAGYKIWTEPKAKVWHDESASTKNARPIKLFYYTRNSMIFMSKYAKNDWGSFVVSFGWKMIKQSIKFLAKLQFSSIRAIILGFAAFSKKETGKSLIYKS